MPNKKDYIIGNDIYRKDEFWKKNMHEIPDVQKWIDADLHGVSLQNKVLYSNDKNTPDYTLPIYNACENGGSFHWVEFRSQDIDIMKMCALQWMENYIQNKKHPALSLHHFVTLEEDLITRGLSIFLLKKNGISPGIIEKLWETFLRFNEDVFVNSVFYQKQTELWLYIEKVYFSDITFFAPFKEQYIQLLLRHITALIGKKLGNCVVKI